MKKTFIKIGGKQNLYKNGEKFIKFVEKLKFHKHKRSILVNNIDIYKIVVSNKVSFDKIGFKYFIAYKEIFLKN